MTGSSTVMGVGVPREKSFAALLPQELSRETGRNVELYNEGLISGHPKEISRWFDQVLNARPDLILWAVSTHDIIVDPDQPPMLQQKEDGGHAAEMWSVVKNEFGGKSVPEAIRHLWGISRTALMLRHFLYQSRSQYIKSYLMADDESGFLKVEPSEEWQRRIQRFSGYEANIEAQARAAGIPLVVVQLPERAQVAMVSAGEWPAGYDPYKLGNELRSMVSSHGGTYIDILPGFRDMPRPEQYFFPVDTHPDADGHAIISGLLSKELTNGSVPALKAVTASQAELERQK